MPVPPASLTPKALGITPGTVRNHLKAVFRKLGVRSQAALIDHMNGPVSGL